MIGLGCNEQYSNKNLGEQSKCGHDETAHQKKFMYIFACDIIHDKSIFLHPRAKANNRPLGCWIKYHPIIVPWAKPIIFIHLVILAFRGRENAMGSLGCPIRLLLYSAVCLCFDHKPPHPPVCPHDESFPGKTNCGQSTTNPWHHDKKGFTMFSFKGIGKTVGIANSKNWKIRKIKWSWLLLGDYWTQSKRRKREKTKKLSWLFKLMIFGCQRRKSSSRINLLFFLSVIQWFMISKTLRWVGGDWG